MATTLAMLESKATTAEKLILMLRQQIGEARAAQVEEDQLKFSTVNIFFSIKGRAAEGCLSKGGREAENREPCFEG